MSHSCPFPHCFIRIPRKWILLALGAILVTGLLWYQSYRQSLIEPVRMIDAEQGIFQSHPDNVFPDKGAKNPAEML